jgi:predicted MFS family arabinose efflux permease
MHKNIKLLLLASILIHSGANLLAPIYAIFIEKIGGTLVDAGFALGIYAIFKGIFYFVFTKINEKRFSKRIMMFSGYVIMGMGYFAYIFANKPIDIFIIQAVLSLGETIINPSWSAIIATSLEKGKERHIYSHFYGYRAIFEGIAAIAGGLFAMKFGFDVIFGIMAGFALVSALLTLMIKEETSKPIKL